MFFRTNLTMADSRTLQLNCSEMSISGSTRELPLAGIMAVTVLDVSPKSGPVPPFITATIQETHLSGKALRDVKRIAESCALREILVCCAERVSEDLAIQSEAEIRAAVPSIESIRIHGRERLTQLSMRFPRAVEGLYAAELAELRGIYSQESTIPEIEELAGLRIALTTQLHEDAQARREDLVRNLILSALAIQPSLNTTEIANRLSQSLHLPRSVNVSYFQDEVVHLVDEGLLSEESHRFTLTDRGREELETRGRAGKDRLAIGQVEIRQLIERLTGSDLLASEWKVVWNILADGIANLFLAHGAVIVDTIASILQGETTTEDHGDFIDHIDAIAARVAALPGGGTHLQDVAQAVRDMFNERESAAFEWLADLCSIYVDMCSLGLESRSQEQLIAVLKTIALVLDTDIVLSILGEGEGNHIQAREIVAGWRKIGGELGVVVPVLEEAAHHAWIADSDYEPNWRRLDKMSDDDAQHVIENVFVRGFRAAGKGQYGPNRWRGYIAAFRGESDHDYDKVLGLLSDHGVRLVTAERQDTAFEQRLEEQLYRERANDSTRAERLKAIREKCNRDARLAAFIVGYRTRLAASGRTAAIVSTSRAVRAAVELCPQRLGPPEPVMYLSAVAWLLSQVPGVHLSLGALRGVLFDANIRKRFVPLERHVVRIVQASEEYSLHWSRRNTLQRAVRQQLGKLAADRGESRRALKGKALSGTDEGNELLVSAVSEALDQVARSRSEQEAARLHSRIEELEQMLEAERRKRK